MCAGRTDGNGRRCSVSGEPSYRKVPAFRQSERGAFAESVQRFREFVFAVESRLRFGKSGKGLGEGSPLHTACALLQSWPTIFVLSAAAIYCFRCLGGDNEGSLPASPNYRALMVRDPAIGSYIDISRQLKLGKPLILICSTLCNCHANELMAISQRPHSAAAVRVAVPDSEGSLSAAPALAKYKSLLVFDDKQILISRLNAAFLPRAYLFSKSGQLLWMSSSIQISYSKLVSQADAVLTDQGVSRG